MKTSPCSDRAHSCFCSPSPPWPPPRLTPSSTIPSTANPAPHLPPPPLPSARPTPAASSSSTTSTTSPPATPPPAASPSTPSAPAPTPKPARPPSASISSPSSAASPPKPRSAPRVLGSTQLDGFRIEKILYDSQPGLHVTALLYLPTPSPATRLPAILLAPGHGNRGKFGDFFLAASFARHGFAVLSYDPIGQGERLQYPDPAHPNTSLASRDIGEHGESSLQPTLLGDTLARYFLWDAIRSLDYLTSRPEIDPARIGAFGCSGGGLITALTTAFDPRIAAAATACFLTSFDTLLPTLGPRDGEQSIPGFIHATPAAANSASLNLDFPDWVELAAPRPYAIVSTEADMFPFAGAQTSALEARRFYTLFHADPDLEFITGPGRHGDIRALAPQILAFFQRHLQPGTRPLTPPTYDFPLAAPPPVIPPHHLTPFPTRRKPEVPPAPQPPSHAIYPPLPDIPRPPDAVLQVTPTGQVATSYPSSETVYSLNRKRADQIAPLTRHSLSSSNLHAAILSVTGSATHPGTRTHQTAEPSRGASNPDYDRDWLLLHDLDTAASPPLPITTRAAIAFPRTPGRHPAVLLLTDTVYPSPAATAADAAIFAEQTRLAQAGNVVLVLGPRPSPPGTEEIRSPILGPFYTLSLRAQVVGKTLLGLRIDDTILALNYLASRHDVDPAQITAIASGHLGLVLLHAAVLDPLLSHITIDHTLSSYRSLLEAPLPSHAPEDILPGVLLHYDIPDLVKALGPRLTFTQPLTGTDNLSQTRPTTPTPNNPAKP